MDPIADKLLISAAFISLVQMGLVPAWMVVIIIGREFTVQGLRTIASAEGFTIQASALGKTKTVLQILAASAVIPAGQTDVTVNIAGFAVGATTITATSSRGAISMRSPR